MCFLGKQVITVLAFSQNTRQQAYIRTRNRDVMFVSDHQRGRRNGNSVTSLVMGSHCKVLELIGTSPTSPLTLPPRSRGPMGIDRFCSLVVGDAVEKAEERLKQTWYPRVTSLFSGEGEPYIYQRLPRLCVHTHQ